jgi:hypothetical protein
MDKETKRAAMGLSQVIGSILLIISVYMYFFYPQRAGLMQ